MSREKIRGKATLGLAVDCRCMHCGTEPPTKTTRWQASESKKPTHKETRIMETRRSGY